jgi:type IV pilus assembly protein PilF
MTVACGTTQAGKASPDQQSVGEYDLARDSFQRRQLRQALEHVENAVKLNEDNADAHYLGAVILLNFCALGESSSDCRFPVAEKYARKAIEAAPEHRDAKNTLGVILIHEKRYEEAISVLKPLANDMLYSSPEKSWGNLGWAYLERGSTDEAIDALRRAVAAQPMFCVGHYRLGLAYEKKGEAQLAREALTRAVDTDDPVCKRLQDAFFARARLGQKLGMPDDAKKDLERCRDVARSTPVGQRCAAQLQNYP